MLSTASSPCRDHRPWPTTLPIAGPCWTAGGADGAGLRCICGRSIISSYYRYRCYKRNQPLYRSDQVATKRGGDMQEE
jgi:hypothetical protein